MQRQPRKPPAKHSYDANLWTGSGNLVANPEIRYTSSGKAVAKFAIGNHPRNPDEAPSFFDVVAWEQLGENVNATLTKGMKVNIKGRLVIRSYEDRDGNKRKSTEIVAFEVAPVDFNALRAARDAATTAT